MTTRDNGYAALIARLDAAKRLAVSVGVHESEGSASVGALTVAQIAEINEFGLGPPARPAITGWAESRRESAPREIRDRMAAALKARVSVAQALDQLAQFYAGEVQTRISGGTPPPNAASTIARKGSSTPLVDTGTFRASIRGKVIAL